MVELFLSQPLSSANSEAALLVDVLFAAPGFPAALVAEARHWAAPFAAEAEAGWTARSDVAAWVDCPQSPHFGAIGRLR